MNALRRIIDIHGLLFLELLLNIDNGDSLELKTKNKINWLIFVN